MVDRAHVANWIAGYEHAWRTTGTAMLPALFTDDATYSMEPYEPAVQGIDAIGELWERERVSADESFTMTWDLVAVEGDTGVARIEVHYHDTGGEFRDLWIIDFAADGRCASFEEWPFWPTKGHVPEEWGET